MTENLPEGKSPSAGGPSANSAPSSDNTQPSSDNLAVLVTNLSQNFTNLEKQVRSMQAGKDRAVTRVEKTVAEIAKLLGVDEGKVLEAQRSMVLDQLVKQQFGNAEEEPSGSGPAPQARVEMESIVTSLGLKANDPEVLAVSTRETDPLKLVVELGKIAIAKAKLPAMEDSQEPPKKGKSPSPKDMETLVGDYVKEVLANAGKANVIRDIQRKYQELGVDTGKVTFR
jgi:hypothetical protein